MMMANLITYANVVTMHHDTKGMNGGGSYKDTYLTAGQNDCNISCVIFYGH